MEETPFYKENEEVDTIDCVGFESKVVLFNDEWHSFDEVTQQLIKATACTQPKAEAITWEVHSKGKGIAYSGQIHDCIRVSSVLEEIQLNTQVEC